MGLQLAQIDRLVVCSCRVLSSGRRCRLRLDWCSPSEFFAQLRLRLEWGSGPGPTDQAACDRQSDGRSSGRRATILGGSAVRRSSTACGGSPVACSPATRGSPEADHRTLAVKSKPRTPLDDMEAKRVGADRLTRPLVCPARAPLQLAFVSLLLPPLCLLRSSFGDVVLCRCWHCAVGERLVEYGVAGCGDRSASGRLARGGSEGEARPGAHPTDDNVHVRTLSGW